ncbi:MAG: DUF1573 domain-containing protein [Verrucomicrobia bacterium]|nr:DUF1573 domain-containing protein [Verrucomicrobiota bacterium]
MRASIHWRPRRTARAPAWLIALTVAIGWIAPLRAGLTWDTTTVERVAKVGEDAVRLTFAFSNPGPRAITIVDLKPSCGCTVAVLDQRTYGPGEKGALPVVFDTRDFSGVQEKTIEVFTDDAPKPTTLTLRVTIPPWIEVAPRLLWWTVGENAAAKAALVTVHPEAKIKTASVASDHPAIAGRLETIEAGRRYRLIATPASTATPVQASLTLTLAADGAPPRKFIVFAQVR